MPSHIKAILSIVVVLVVGGFGYATIVGGNVTVGWVICVLTVIMVLSIWLFPETRRVKRGDKR